MYCVFRAFLISPLRHFTILGQKNVQNMPRYYTVEQGNNTGLKSSDKMAAQKKLNFALFTSSGLDFLTEELFTERDILTEQTVLFVFRTRIMQSIRCKMDYEN